MFRIDGCLDALVALVIVQRGDKHAPVATYLGLLAVGLVVAGLVAINAQDVISAHIAQRVSPASTSHGALAL